MAFTQENRLVALDTPLGKDVLLLRGFSGRESISRLFTFRLDLLSEKSDIAFKDIIGQQVTIRVLLSDGSKERYFNGFVSRFAQSGSGSQFTNYQMEVVPWLWFLTRSADCRIFQNETIPDIIQDVFKIGGYSDFKNSVAGEYEPLEYCVQYRETDFNFVSRLMEQYGIFYYFEHKNGKHTLVMADSSSVHQPCPDQNSASYNQTTGDLDAEDVITAWNMEQELRTGKYSLTDYNFETPKTSLMAEEPTVMELGGNSNFEIYDYPGDHLTKAQGSAAAKIHMQEEEAGNIIISGSSVCRAFTSGYKFDLKDHPRDDMNSSYILTEVQHVATVGSYSQGTTPTPAHYSNQFTCIPAWIPFRPARVTPKPFVQGPQTALVVGKSGEEIWVDKYGRIKVQFYWDRLGQKDENSSCWIRVSQAWAGQGWGAMWIPRMGQEVVVSFVEGDPDRPLITGRLYNADQTVPYALPDNQTRSTFISRSSKGGDAKTYNEIRFEDKKGSEHLLIHAEKLKMETVEADSVETVGHDRLLTVENDQKEWIKGEKDLHVVKDHKEKIEGAMSIHVVGDQMQKVEGDQNNNVIGNLNEKIGQSASLDIGMNLAEKVGMNQSMDVGMNLYLKAGMNLVLEAGMAITLKAAGGFITIGPGGIFISGQPLVMINSGGAAVPGSAGSLTAPKDPVDPKDPGRSDDPYK
jgi:type VI secretion system secreted protein VgrG